MRIRLGIARREIALPPLTKYNAKTLRCERQCTLCNVGLHCPLRFNVLRRDLRCNVQLELLLQLQQTIQHLNVTYKWLTMRIRR